MNTVRERILGGKMNAQKSHDWLLKKFDELCRNYIYQSADKIECEQALYDGAEALEKQIPKKLTVNEEIYCCPRCGGKCRYFARQ